MFLMSLNKYIKTSFKYDSILKKFQNFLATEATFETKPYQLHRLQEGPSTKVIVTKSEAIELYTQMYKIRRLETSAATLYGSKQIRGFCHLYTGQEAVAIGVAAALRPHDIVTTSYRDHGWAVATGIAPVNILAECTGKKSGCSRGKGGSMHMYGERLYGGNAIVGAQVSLGVGIAFAQQYKGNGGVGVAVYGDGAANQGQVYESFNIAKLWNLPCIFLCENNRYGMGTSAERASANTAYYTKGDLIPGIWSDGMDVLSVREVAKYAVQHCSSSKGPIVLEMATYRYGGHSMSDPGTSYRKREEVDEMRKTRDPLNIFKNKLISTNLVTDDEFRKIEKGTQKLIDEATETAINDTEIGLEELTADIYAVKYPDIRNVTPFKPIKHINLKRQSTDAKK